MDEEQLKSTLRKLEAAIEALKLNAVPVGTVCAFAMRETPDGWLICDGRELPRSREFRALFEAIGTTFGAGDGTTTFNLPNLLGMFLRGWDSWGNIDPQRDFGSEQGDAFQAHGHESIPHTHEVSCNESGTHKHRIKETRFTYSSGTFSGDDYTVYRYCYDGEGGDDRGCDEAGSHSHLMCLKHASTIIGSPIETDSGKCRAGIETRPCNVAMLFCIKY